MANAHTLDTRAAQGAPVSTRTRADAFAPSSKPSGLGARSEQGGAIPADGGAREEFARALRRKTERGEKVGNKDVGGGAERVEKRVAEDARAESTRARASATQEAGEKREVGVGSNRGAGRRGSAVRGTAKGTAATPQGNEREGAATVEVECDRNDAAKDVQSTPGAVQDGGRESAEAAAQTGENDASRVSAKGLPAQDTSVAIGATRDSLSDVNDRGVEAPLAAAALEEEQPLTNAAPSGVASAVALFAARPLTIESLNQLLIGLDPALSSRLLKSAGVPGRAGEISNPASAGGQQDHFGANSEGELVDGAAAASEEGAAVAANLTRQDETAALHARANESASAAGGEHAQQPSGQSPENEDATTSGGKDQVRESQRAPLTNRGGSAGGAGISRSPQVNPAPAAAQAFAIRSRFDSAAGGAAGIANVAVTGVASAGVGAAAPTSAPSTLPAPNSDRMVYAQATPQIAQALANMVLQRGGSMTLRLNPELLGQLRVQMETKNDTCSVRLDASSAATADALAAGRGELESTLRERGLRLTELVIDVDDSLSPQSERDDHERVREDDGIARQSAAEAAKREAGMQASRARIEAERGGGGAQNATIVPADADALTARLGGGGPNHGSTSGHGSHGDFAERHSARWVAAAGAGAGSARGSAPFAPLTHAVSVDAAGRIVRHRFATTA
ncbi:hypothetical protein BH11PLA1_BH11PLA1_08990 [soil metagenome]